MHIARIEQVRIIIPTIPVLVDLYADGLIATVSVEPSTEWFVLARGLSQNRSLHCQIVDVAHSDGIQK
jgi:hypothetical protein